MSDSPELKRRRLKIALRREREHAELTQKEAAEALDWHVSKIIRIEAGSVGITPTDVRALLTLYRVANQAQVDELVELARGSRKQSFREYKDVYSSASLTFFANEGSAKAIFKYEPTFMPGLLQTEEYARALLTGLGHGYDEVERMVHGRLERQEVLDREAHPELHFIMGEAVLRRVVGGPGVMANQVAALKYISTHVSRIYLQILPFSSGAHPRMGGAFTILEFEDPDLDDLLYLENAGGESVSREDPDLIADYRRDFITLEGMACTSKDFPDYIDTIAADFAAPKQASLKGARPP